MILVEKDQALSLVLPLARFQELSGAMGALSGLARVSTALFTDCFFKATPSSY